MFTSFRIAAAIAVALLITTAAEARQPAWGGSQITRYCGDRVCTIQGALTSQPSKRHHAARQVDANGSPAYQKRWRAAKAVKAHPRSRQAVLIDKPQEYVKPTSPTDKLVTREAHERGSGIVRSRKTGATAHVSPRYAPQFQAYINDIEAEGATVRFIGGIRRGPCWSGGLHPCGKAIDVCQLSRGRVDARCHLPGPARLAAIARKNGLLEGGVWCNSDYGHAQVGMTAGPCGSNLYSAVRKYKRHKRMARLR